MESIKIQEYAVKTGYDITVKASIGHLLKLEFKRVMSAETLNSLIDKARLLNSEVLANSNKTVIGILKDGKLSLMSTHPIQIYVEHNKDDKNIAGLSAEVVDFENLDTDNMLDFMFLNTYVQSYDMKFLNFENKSFKNLERLPNSTYTRTTINSSWVREFIDRIALTNEKYQKLNDPIIHEIKGILGFGDSLGFRGSKRTIYITSDLGDTTGVAKFITNDAVVKNKNKIKVPSIVNIKQENKPYHGKEIEVITQDVYYQNIRLTRESLENNTHPVYLYLMNDKKRTDQVCFSICDNVIDYDNVVINLRICEQEQKYIDRYKNDAGIDVVEFDLYRNKINIKKLTINIDSKDYIIRGRIPICLKNALDIKIKHLVINLTNYDDSNKSRYFFPFNVYTMGFGYLPSDYIKINKITIIRNGEITIIRNGEIRQ